MMAWGGTVGVLAGLIAVAFELVQGQICEYNQATEHEECTTYSLVPFLLIQVGKTLNNYGVAITALATVAIGFFTLTLKLSTDKLWEAGEKQRKLYEVTAERQLRAYVFASDVKVLQFFAVPRVTAEFKNFGQTPSDEITISYNIKIADVPITEELGIGPALPVVPMAPGSSVHMDDSYAVTQEQRSEIAGGEAAIYILEDGGAVVNPQPSAVFIGQRPVFGLLLEASLRSKKPPNKSGCMSSR